jgi:pimeloyl-ACP methyl ester carboxylesterase
MTAYATSADGTRIGFDRLGRGSPLVLIGGILGDRQRMAELASTLAARFDVVNYDRRGRGDSTAGEPYAVEREIEDLAAVIAEIGGASSLYGHSSGAGVALRAATAGLPITRLVLHEPPFGPDDPDSRHAAEALATTVRTAIDEDRRSVAVAAFLTESGLPPDLVDEISRDLATLALAPTMVHDHTVMGDFDEGGTIPEAVVRRIRIPTLVVAGGASPDFFRDTAGQLVELLADGRLTVIPGADHGAPADVVAPAIVEFIHASSKEHTS